MKRILSIILTLFIFAGAVFAQDDGDEYYDDFVYETNGAGDQFLIFGLGAFVPVNFGGSVRKGYGTLYTGGNIDAGYYRFLSKNIAVGGEINASYNLSIGHKTLVTLPISFGGMYQPTIGKFEFPLFLSIGVGYETWQNMNYFPSLAVKASGGVFYRVSEAFSFGAEGSFFYLPQWFKDSSQNFNGCFTGINIIGRYHF